MERYIYNIVGLLLLFTGCNVEPAHYSEELLQLELRVDAVPDSVYSCLDSFDTGKMSEADRALFITIRTEAADKLYKEHPTDSLIAEAVKFFEKKHDTPRIAKAWYLAGRIHSDWKEWTMATEDFLKAKELTEDSEDYGLRGRIANHLGVINFKNKLYDIAQKYHKEAYLYFKYASSNIGIADALKNIGSTFFPLQKPDSILFYYKAALEVAKTTDNNRLLCNIYDGLGYVYTDAKQYDKAIICLKKAINITTSPDSCHFFADLGKLYTNIYQLDSAKFYLQKALACTSLPTRYMGYKYLAKIAEQENDVKTAFQYRTQQDLLKDSIEHYKKSEKVLTLQHQHKQQNLSDSFIETVSQMSWLYSLLLAGLFAGASVWIMRLYRHIQRKKGQLMSYKKQLQCLIGDIRQNEATIQSYKTHWTEMVEQAASEKSEIDRLKEEIQTMNEKNQQLIEQLYQLAINECKQHPFFKPLYDSQSCLREFTPTQWKNFNKALDFIFPDFRKKLQLYCPDITQNHQRICSLLLLGLKHSQISDIMGLQASSLSVYKNMIKKKYFSNSCNSSLEQQLRQLFYLNYTQN